MISKLIIVLQTLKNNNINIKMNKYLVFSY